MDFRVRKRNVEFRAYRDNRSTGQVRRYMNRDADKRRDAEVPLERVIGGASDNRNRRKKNRRVKTNETLIQSEKLVGRCGTAAIFTGNREDATAG